VGGSGTVFVTGSATVGATCVAQQQQQLGQSCAEAVNV
jgi:hypothetical protein